MDRLSKPARAVIYSALFLFAWLYWTAFFWLATANGD
jgi:hypothetical protein